MSKLNSYINCVYNGLTHSNGYEASVALVCELFCEQTGAETFITPLNADISCRGLTDGAHEDKITMVVPIYSGKVLLGSFVAMRKHLFLEEEKLMGKLAAALIATNLQALKNENNAADAREESAVRAAIGTLSYSELEAAAEVLRHLHEDEGNIIASTIAAKSRVTRSAIVNALRKLESAGLLEAHSMGAKGTFIKIKTPALREGLRNLMQ